MRVSRSVAPSLEPLVVHKLRLSHHQRVFRVVLLLVCALLAAARDTHAAVAVAHASEDAPATMNDVESLHKPQFTTWVAEVAQSPLDALHDCPPCFNCHLDRFNCLNNGHCSPHDGRCSCPAGFGGERCDQPLCDSPLEGPDRRPRGTNETSCTCSDGYSGINCNICAQDEACSTLFPDAADPGVCYSAIAPVRENFLQCQVTNKAILQQLNGQIPDITYTCNSLDSTCEFQFWINELESFFCGLQDCHNEMSFDGAGGINKTQVTCNTMKCGCYPGRPLCDPNGMDLSEWFKNNDDDEEGGPSGPGTLQCEERHNPADGAPARTCRFMEPHMNKLISTVFGDDSITLVCPFSGECLPRSAVPKYGGGGGGDGGDDSDPSLVRYSKLMLALMVIIALGTLFFVMGFLAWTSWHGVSGAGAPPSMLDLAKSTQGNGMAGDNATISSDSDHATVATPSSLIFWNVSYTVTTFQGNKSIEALKKRASHSRGPSGAYQIAESVDEEPCDSESAPLMSSASSSAEVHRKILYGASGYVGSGEILAIMGGSGAGKSTLLDILANRNKAGRVKGNLLVNGETITSSAYRSICGFVDQEDTHMETLTVFEAIYFSASLRLPSTMSAEAKRRRVLETMDELGILHIANSTIGGSSIGRGISGGEKRRVSIACELVTSPSIIFLDEPTSGLDAFSAYNVVAALNRLAKKYGRTIILTIHQPRSNIYSMFDSLVLLARGRTIYSGPAKDCFDYFSAIGYTCPQGFNIADYLIDVSMGPLSPTAANVATNQDALTISDVNPEDELSFNEVSSSSSDIVVPHEDNMIASATRRAANKNSGKANAAQNQTNNAIRINGNDPQRYGLELAKSRAEARAKHIEKLRAIYKASKIYVDIEERYKAHFEGMSTSNGVNGVSNSENTANDVSLHRGSHRIFNDRAESPNRSASSLLWMLNPFGYNTIELTSAVAISSMWHQFVILSGRSFKNLYRHPALIRAQYGVAIVTSLVCGFFFYNVDNSLSGFQNRMGVFFFICAVFGFSCLSSMQVFVSERYLFKRERANGYYTTLPYFMAKVVFDIIPLRVIPPIMFSLITYHLIGLREDSIMFLLKFILVIVLYNVTAACCCLAISIIFPEYGVAVLVATLVMLFEMLFGGMLINRAMMSYWSKWIVSGSFFNAAWEALLVNEVLGLTLIEKKFNLSIKVPGALILETFGLNHKGYNGDVVRLIAMSLILLLVGFFWLKLFVRERR